MSLTTVKNKIFKDDITRNSAIIITSGIASSALNYLYQVSMGRLLTPEEYGTVVSLLSVLVIISVLSSTLDTTVTKYISAEAAHPQSGRLAYLWRLFIKQGFFWGLAVFLIVSAFSPLISRFLNISDYRYAIILFSSMLFTFAMCVNLGTLKGLQRFVAFGLNSVLWTFLKFALGIGLVYMGLKVNGALLALSLAYVVVFAVSLLSLRDVVSAPVKKVSIDGLHSFALSSLFSFLAFTVFTNMDVIMAKHYLSPLEAGSYSAIATIGKLSLFLSAGVAVAMFPQISRLSESGITYKAVLFKALILTSLIAGGIVIIFWVFPEFVSNVLFSNNFSDIAPFLARYALAMGCFALSNLLMLYLLSIKQTKIAFPLIMTAVIQLVLIYFFHSNITQIVNMLLFSGIISLVSITLFCLYLWRKNAFSHHARL